MSYLSRRCREIREENEARRNRRLPLPFYARSPGENIDIAYSPMAMVDPGMQRLQDLAYERYEQTMLARNPHMREHINFKGRAG